MKNQDDFSLVDEEQSLGSGFVIRPRNDSVSIITDEFQDSVSSSSTETPLAQIIGRFNFFGKVRDSKGFKSADTTLSLEIESLLSLEVV